MVSDLYFSMSKVQIQVSMREPVKYPARYRISGRHKTGYEIKKNLKSCGAGYPVHLQKSGSAGLILKWVWLYVIIRDIYQTVMLINQLGPEGRHTWSNKRTVSAAPMPARQDAVQFCLSTTQPSRQRLSIHKCSPWVSPYGFVSAHVPEFKRINRFIRLY